MIEIYESEWFRSSANGYPRWLDDEGAQFEYWSIRNQLYAQMMGWA